MNLGFKEVDVLIDEKSAVEAVVRFTPLERGFGYTLGNALRRTLMSSMPGTSIVGVQFSNVRHQFKFVPGTIHDGTEIIANVRNAVFSYEGNEVLSATLDVDKAGEYYAKDFQLPEGVKVETPDALVLKATGDEALRLTIYLTAGRGYFPSDNHDFLEGLNEEGIIPTDANFTKVVEAPKIVVNPKRIGQNTNYEELELTIRTNGEISPDKAVTLASKILCSKFAFIQDRKEQLDVYELYEERREKESELHTEPIETLKLKKRAYNRLKQNNVHTIGQIMHYSKKQLNGFEQMGERSINEIIEKLEEKGIYLDEN